MKIMIVDDCPTTRKLLTLYLKGKGYDVVTAENGLDGLEKLGRHAVNLILTDLNMPYMDGIEFVKAVRNDPSKAGLPIIVVTTEKDAEERERAAAAGADGYLTKPVTAEVVTDQIKKILKQIFSQGGTGNA